MCSVGAIKPVLSRKSYKMCWGTHEVVAEAIRLLQKQYVAHFISEKLVEQSKSDHTTLKTPKNLKNIMRNMLKCKNDVVLVNLE